MNCLPNRRMNPCMFGCFPICKWLEHYWNKWLLQTIGTLANKWLVQMVRTLTKYIITISSCLKQHRKQNHLTWDAFLLLFPIKLISLRHPGKKKCQKTVSYLMQFPIYVQPSRCTAWWITNHRSKMIKQIMNWCTSAHKLN